MSTITKEKLPLAAQMLRDFHEVAVRVDKFLSLPNDGLKYVFWKGNAPLRALQVQLGISGRWVNAVDLEGLLDKVSVHQVSYVPAKDVYIVAGRTTTTADFSWNGGAAPDYYEPLHPTSKSGAELLAEYLRQASASNYLQRHGVTESAIAAALAAG
jgi:hypothetical protein